MQKVETEEPNMTGSLSQNTYSEIHIHDMAVWKNSEV